MAKRLLKAAEIEKRLAELEGPEWDSDDEKVEESTITLPKAEAITLGKAAAVKAAGAAGGETAKGKKVAGGGKAEEGAATVIYLGHVPHGFYEEQMKGFLGQFGEIKRLRLSRSKRTGGSKGYAFIEFESSDVARIVSKTMNGYMLSDKQLVCELVPPEKVHPRVFDGHDRKMVPVPWRAMSRTRQNAPKLVAADDTRKKRLLATERKRRAALEAAGVEYSFGGYAACTDELPKPRAKKARVEAEAADDDDETEAPASTKSGAKKPANVAKAAKAAKSATVTESNPKGATKAAKVAPAKAAKADKAAKAEKAVPAKAKAEKAAPAKAPAKRKTKA